MIFLQGLEKVQVTIQTQSELLLESTVTKWKNGNVQNNNTASAVFSQTQNCYWMFWLNLMLSWF